MEVIVGKLSGFCNGVKYTIEKANEVINNNKNVYCLGQIVHNERVINDLENKGMITINDILKCPNNSKLIIRAHGELKKTYDIAKEKNIELIDLTCGKIKVIRKKIDNKKDDHFIVIIGKKNHPETLGVQSFSGKDSFIVEEKDDLKKCLNKIEKSNLNKIFVVSQTTFNSEKFDELVSLLKTKTDKEIVVDKTICNATSNRQKETEELSKKVDTMIIVGGKNSSNTKELAVVASENCKQVLLIQDYHEINKELFNQNDRVGIMAGASTPDIVVEEIIQLLS